MSILTCGCGCSCGSNEGPKLIFSCSGCADVGELADQSDTTVGGVKLLQIEMLGALPEELGQVFFVHPLIDRYRQQMQLAAVGLVKPAAHTAFLVQTGAVVTSNNYL